MWRETQTRFLSLTPTIALVRYQDGTPFHLSFWSGPYVVMLGLKKRSEWFLSWTSLLSLSTSSPFSPAQEAKVMSRAEDDHWSVMPFRNREMKMLSCPTGVVNICVSVKVISAFCTCSWHQKYPQEKNSITLSFMNGEKHKKEVEPRPLHRGGGPRRPMKTWLSWLPSDTRTPSPWELHSPAGWRRGQIETVITLCRWGNNQ